MLRRTHKEATAKKKIKVKIKDKVVETRDDCTILYHNVRSLHFSTQLEVLVGRNNSQVFGCDAKKKTAIVFWSFTATLVAPEQNPSASPNPIALYFFPVILNSIQSKGGWRCAKDEETAQCVKETPDMKPLALGCRGNPEKLHMSWLSSRADPYRSGKEKKKI